MAEKYACGESVLGTEDSRVEARCKAGRDIEGMDGRAWDLFRVVSCVTCSSVLLAMNRIISRTPNGLSGTRESGFDRCGRIQSGVCGWRRELKAGNKLTVGVLYHSQIW